MSNSERRFLAREEPAELQVARTSGGFLFEANGKKYVDFVMGWCAGNLRWSNPALTRRAGDTTGPDYIYPRYSYKPWTELANLLASSKR